MALTKQDLAQRIRAARDSAQLTQSGLAKDIGLSRSALAEIELGKRAVSGLELERIAFALGRDAGEFLADEFQEADFLHALFRAAPEFAARKRVGQQLQRCLSVARELQNLEQLLEIGRSSQVPSYELSPPVSRWEAIQQGQQVADSERWRLGLGKGPIQDVAAVLESQNVRIATVKLPDQISGLTIARGTVAPFVAVNSDHPAVRQRFSFAHEYCHALVDRSLAGRISKTTDNDDLLEVRSNSFAAAFLMPEDGVRDAIEKLGKGRTSRMTADIFDESATVHVEQRTEPKSQDIQWYDVWHLASLFGTSRAAMMFRLRNLRFITESELIALRSDDSGDKPALLQRTISKPTPNIETEEGVNRHQRFVLLAFEAFRRMKISLSKLRELLSLVQVKSLHTGEFLALAGVDENTEQR